MAAGKDPAFLFYSSDFLSGVADLTMEERGQYITLMCLQHQKGHLSEKTIWLALGFDLDIQNSDVMKKFVVDEEGLYYNRRLEEEIKKRVKAAEAHRTAGRLGGKPKQKDTQKANQKVSQKTTQTENENEDENEDMRKKDKRTKYADFVSMTNDEYSSLVADLGESGAKRCVEILDNYKGANGKKYKSDYRAIRNWVIGRYREERAKGGKTGAGPKNDYSDIDF